MHQPRRFNIPYETLLEAKKCVKKHACLKEESYQLCGIKITTEHHARMVCGKNPDRQECPYTTQLGNNAVCACPVRHAIFRKYDV